VYHTYHIGGITYTRRHMKEQQSEQNEFAVGHNPNQSRQDSVLFPVYIYSLDILVGR